MVLVEVGLFGILVEVMEKFCKYVLNLGYLCVFILMRFVDLGFNVNILSKVLMVEVFLNTTMKASPKWYLKSTEIISIFSKVWIQFTWNILSATIDTISLRICFFCLFFLKRYISSFLMPFSSLRAWGAL